MQNKEGINTNYFYLATEKIEEFETRFGCKFTFGEIVVMVLGYLNESKPDKAFFLDMSDRDFYNAVCKAYERERKLEKQINNE